MLGNLQKQIGELIDGQKSANEKLDLVLEALLSLGGESATAEQPAIVGAPSELIEVRGMEAPWVLGSLKWDGKHEVNDQEELQKWLGFNPNDKDSDGKSWCAGFLKRVLEDCGIDTTGLDLMATSFKTFGYELEDIVDGAILVFEPSEESDFPIRHVGVAVDNRTKLFGGNQGNSAKRSNLDWYLAHAELTAIRCVNGYKLVA